MRYSFGKTVVVALGGSIIYPHTKRRVALRAQVINARRSGVGVNPDTIDIIFLKNFKKFIEGFIRKGFKFVIVVGGGQLARLFQDAAHRVSPLTDEDRDWIGIHSTRLNAHLLRTIFRKIADPVVFDARGKMKRVKYPVTIASGWRPGWSTDFVAAAIATDLKISDYIVAGKPSHVFDKDPRKFKGAVPFFKINWKGYRKLIPRKWVPGSHAPVDPVAAKLSDEKKLKSIIINGKDLKNFERLLNGKEFKGTIISNAD